MRITSFYTTKYLSSKSNCIFGYYKQILRTFTVFFQFNLSRNFLKNLIRLFSPNINSFPGVKIFPFFFKDIFSISLQFMKHIFQEKKSKESDIYSIFNRLIPFFWRIKLPISFRTISRLLPIF